MNYVCTRLMFMCILHAIILDDLSHNTISYCSYLNILEYKIHVTT